MTDSTSQSPSQKPRWTNLMIVAAVVGLVAMPILFYGCTTEIAQWRFASIVNLYQSGEEEVAFNRLQELVEVHVHDRGMKKRLALWHLERNEPEAALELIDQLWESSSADAQLFGLRERALVAVEKYEEALEVHKEFNNRFSRLQFSRNSKRNDLAYLRALAGKELNTAIYDINLVLASIDAAWRRQREMYLPDRSRVYLLSALCYSRAPDRRDGNESAVRLLTRAIDSLEGKLDALAKQSIDAAAQRLQLGSPSRASTDESMATGSPDEALSSDGQAKNIQQVLAVFYSLRAKVLEDLGDSEQSKQDIQKAVDFDYDPNTLLKRLPEGADAAIELAQLAAYLDTRACVYFKAQQLEEAIQDANTAVLACRTFIDAIEDFKIYHLDPQVQNIDQKYSVGPKKTLAALLYHRSWILEEMGSSAKARADLGTIKELGFQPGPGLNLH